MHKVPPIIAKYLWDVDIKTINLTTHQTFIIERTLEYGDLKSLNWLLKNYNKNQIVKVLKTSRKISPKSGKLFALYFGIPEEKLLCIRKPFTQKQNRF